MKNLTKIDVNDYPEWIKEANKAGYIKGNVYEYKDFIIYRVYYCGEGWNWEAAIKTSESYHSNMLEVIYYNNDGACDCGAGFYCPLLKELVEFLTSLYNHEGLFALCSSFVPDAFMLQNKKIVINPKFVTKLENNTYQYKHQGYETTIKIYDIDNLLNN